MFRRISSRLSAFACTPVALSAAESATTTASSSSASPSPQGNNNNNNAKNRRLNDNLKQVFEVSPRVDFRYASANISNGYFMRMNFTQAAVLVRRVAQSKSVEEKSIFGGEESYLQLPSTTISRMLAVMDGYMDECNVIGRQFQGTFKPSGKGPFTFVLHCTPTSVAAKDAGIVKEWSAEFDAGDSILLQRFLKNSLHYMQGFYHSSQEEE